MTPGPPPSGRRRPLRLLAGLALVLGGALGAVAGPGRLGAEPAGYLETLDPRVPIVTLDALPLGVPLDALTEPARARAEGVLGRSLFAQRVTGLRFPSREPVFRFLVEHPDFAASVARALRLGAYRVTRLDDGYQGDDRRGARGLIRVLHAEPERRLFHLAGRYEPGTLPAVEGQILILLEYRHEDDGHGGSVADVSLTGHLRVDTPLAGALAHFVGLLARPAVEQAVERKVRRFFRTVARVSRWAHDQPELLAAALDGHPEIPPGPELEAFRQILLADRLPAWAEASYSLRPEEATAPTFR